MISNKWLLIRQEASAYVHTLIQVLHAQASQSRIILPQVSRLLDSLFQETNVEKLIIKHFTTMWPIQWVDQCMDMGLLFIHIKAMTLNLVATKDLISLVTKTITWEHTHISKPKKLDSIT